MAPRFSTDIWWHISILFSMLANHPIMSQIKQAVSLCDCTWPLKSFSGVCDCGYVWVKHILTYQHELLKSSTGQLIWGGQYTELDTATMKETNWQEFQLSQVKAIFLYCSPDCPSCPANVIQMSQATLALWTAIKKYGLSLGGYKV